MGREIEGAQSSNRSAHFATCHCGQNPLDFSASVLTDPVKDALARGSQRHIDGPPIVGRTLTGDQPSLSVGKGGRDGETGTLKEFLGWVLSGQVPQQ